MRRFLILAALLFAFVALPLGWAYAAAPSLGASCTDNTEGAQACVESGCFICSSGVWASQPLLLGSTATACGSTLAGIVQYTATGPQYCNGSAWTSMGGSGPANGTTPESFSFTNQTGVDPDTEISSNAVTLSGFAGAVTATCGTNCIDIAKNGVWSGATVTGFQSGDTIAIRQLSSPKSGTATLATVTVGTTTSSSWSVTTTAITPDPITFTDQTGVYTSTTIESNEITLSGFTGYVEATCNGGCIGIGRDGGWYDNNYVGGTTIYDLEAGNGLWIVMKSADTPNTPVTGSVTVGGTTSATWTVTTGDDACYGVTVPGGVCPDGTLFAGYSTANGEHKKLLTTRCDPGQTWNGSACTGTALTFSWDDGTYQYYATGLTAADQGEAYSDALAVATDVGSPYYAAQYCYNLSANGHTDWYLAGYYDGQALVASKAYLNFSGLYYWLAREDPDNAEMAWYMDLDTDGINTYYKSEATNIRCVRMD